MTAFFRKIFMTLVGLAAGIASWGMIEILLLYGEPIGRHIVWNGLAGASIGLLFGFFLGSAEGIMFSEVKRAIRSGIMGGIIGLIGGTAAVIFAQWLLYWIGNAEIFVSPVTDSWITPISRSLGWGLLGLTTGAVEGIRCGSARRAGIGMAGGLLGGFLGGLLLEFLTRLWSNTFLARGAGIAVMGLGIGLFFTLFEHSRAYGLVKVLTGAFRGKEFLLVMKKTKIGSSRWADIPLSDYTGVVKDHAVLTADREGVVLRSEKGVVKVNDQTIKQHELKYEDVIRIGSVKLFYLPT